jgi:PKD repeat protein
VLELKAGGPILSQLALPASSGTGVATRFSVSPVPWGAPLVGQTQWEFGDGTTAIGNDVRHVYAREGTYEVRVSAFAADGASTETRTITIGKPTLANARRPVVQGVPHVGRVVKCERSRWNGTEPITYSVTWLRNGVSAARGDRFRIRAADRGTQLACRVKATNGPKTAVAVSRSVRVR